MIASTTLTKAHRQLFNQDFHFLDIIYTIIVRAPTKNFHFFLCLHLLERVLQFIFASSRLQAFIMEADPYVQKASQDAPTQQKAEEGTYFPYREELLECFLEVLLALIIKVDGHHLKNTLSSRKYCRAR